jgi:hypothetical protein
LVGSRSRSGGEFAPQTEAAARLGRWLSCEIEFLGGGAKDDVLGLIARLPTNLPLGPPGPDNWPDGYAYFGHNFRPLLRRFGEWDYNGRTDLILDKLVSLQAEDLRLAIPELKVALDEWQGRRSTPQVTPAHLENTQRSNRKKRSTERGEGQAKLIAALTKHHQYADGGCLNLEPIGNNELAKAAGVSPSTASAFFKNQFEGHTEYKALCRDTGLLVAVIKLLNNEFSPHNLYSRRPPGEDDRDDEGDD